MISASDRRECVSLIHEAQASGARLGKACERLGLSLRTFQRWTRGGGEVREDRRPTAKRPMPANKLTDAERQAVLDACHSPEFADLPPSQIVPRLADQEIYLASEATFYRILREAGEAQHRGRARPPRRLGPPRSHCATRPNEVWSWDITWLRGPVNGLFFYLYLILDIYSRKIVGWEVYEQEASELGAEVVHRAVLAEGAVDDLQVLHADNGAPQKGSTLLAKLETLGVAASYSRPRVSDDNAHAEAVFRTCKYRPSYPREGFAALEEARHWVGEFVAWYNDEHCHSGIRFVTPESRHRGADVEILANRHQVYEAAKKAHPERWSGATRNWSPTKLVWLNQPRDQKACDPDHPVSSELQVA